MNTKKLSLLGLLLALSLIISYLESLIPFNFGIPGIKLGLTNIVILFVLEFYGVKEAFLLSVMRVLLMSFMFGNFFSVAYSLSGAVFAMLVMSLLRKRLKLNLYSTSIAGGVFHNLGQYIVAVIVLDNLKLFYYLPMLLVSGIITGLLIGIVSFEVIKRLDKANENRS